MRRTFRHSWTCVLALACLLIGTSAIAQDFRGAVGGRVTDSSGGVLPGVTVTVTNKDTNVATNTVTNDTGNYSLLYLQPGGYTVTAELQGFRKTSRENVEVRLGDRLEIDFKLEVGRMEEVVTVAAETPILDTRTGSAGQVIDEKRIALMPLSDGNPFVLARLAPGVAYHGDLKFSRPFDNGGTSDFTADGGPGRNEFTLDGSPNMANGRRVAFVPPAGAVQEFKVETATFDAQQGHTAGATVNVTLKSGTNRFRGDGYYHYRDEALSGNDFFLERAGRPKDTLEYKRYGSPLAARRCSASCTTAATDVLLHRVRVAVRPVPGAGAVHGADRGAAQRRLLGAALAGDRDLRPADGPRPEWPRRAPAVPGEHHSAGTHQRDRARGPEVLADAQPGRDAHGSNNYITSNPRGDDFYSMNYRVDHNLTDKQRFFVRYSRNNRVENRGNWTGEVNGIRPTGNFLFRINDALNVDHVWTMSPSSLLNVRASWSRFQEPSIRQHQGLFDPASLGFPSATNQYFGDNQYFPRFEFDDGLFSDLGDTFSGGTNASIYSFQPTWTLACGNHSFRPAGTSACTARKLPERPLRRSLRFRARSAILHKQLDNSSAAAIGQDWRR